MALYVFFRHLFLREFPPRFIKAARKETDNKNSNHTNKIRDNRDGVLTETCEGFHCNQGKRSFLQGIFLETNGPVKLYARDNLEEKMMKILQQFLLTDNVGVEFFNCNSLYFTVHYPYPNL